MKKTGFFIVLLVGVAMLISYSANIYKFSRCDFKPDYACEAIHGVGVLVPPAVPFTVFFDHD